MITESSLVLLIILYQCLLALIIMVWLGKMLLLGELGEEFVGILCTITATLL